MSTANGVTRWSNRWTVELDSAHAADADHVVGILQSQSGIGEVRLVPPDEIRRLLQPWLHDAALTAELPLPVLIDLKIDRTHPPSEAALTQLLSAASPGVKLDDHGSWTRDLLRLAEAGEAIGLAIFGAIALTAMLTVAATARARLAVNAQEIELLHSLGASDGYIAGQFQAGALRSTSIGVVIGTVIAGAVVAVLLKGAPSMIPFISQLRLGADRLGGAGGGAGRRAGAGDAGHALDRLWFGAPAVMTSTAARAGKKIVGVVLRTALVITAALLPIGVGFVRFVDHLPPPTTDQSETDAIVVLTGGGRADFDSPVPAGGR